jgi:hypothetical protein
VGVRGEGDAQPLSELVDAQTPLLEVLAQQIRRVLALVFGCSETFGRRLHDLSFQAIVLL